MTKNFLSLLAILVACLSISGQARQTQTASTSAQEIIELEKRWANAIQRQDVGAMEQFLAEDYFLAVAVQQLPLQVVPRKTWLENLKVYKIHTLNVDDMKAHVYGDTTVVVMLWTQTATVAGRDRSGQFLLTDIWVKQKNGWRVTERHSSRPEPPVQPRPQ